MANDALILDAPPALFDEFASILNDSQFDCSLASSDAIVRGVRRLDTATFDVTHDSTCVYISMERRLGNPTMFIAVMPTRRSFWRRDAASNRLAEQIVELLVANGADDPA